MSGENQKDKLMKRYNLTALSSMILAFAIALYFFSIIVTSMLMSSVECVNLIKWYIHLSLIAFLMIFVSWLLVFFMDKTAREVMGDERIRKRV